MTAGTLRSASRHVLKLASHLLPSAWADWGRAMAHEVEAIEDGPNAMVFALDCVRGALVVSVRHRISEFARRWTPTSITDQQDPTGMNPHARGQARTLAVGIACAVASILLGIAFMSMAGAPQRLVAVNLAALLIGSGLCLWLASSRWTHGGRLSAGTALLGALLLATAVFGVRADGAARWLSLAGLVIQPSLIFIPPLLLIHAQSESRWTVVGLALAIMAMALQPDRAMAGALAGTLAVVALTRRGRQDLGLAAFAMAGFVMTLLRADNGGVSPFVDRILLTSFETHPFAGIAVVTGSFILLLPTFLGRTVGRDRSVGLAFGSVWSLIVLAALLGNYPTPLVGYGGSAIIGYLLSVAILATASSSQRGRTDISSGKPASDDKTRAVEIVAAA